jgi:hypothetical protein
MPFAVRPRLRFKLSSSAAAKSGRSSERLPLRRTKGNLIGVVFLRDVRRF